MSQTLLRRVGGAAVLSAALAACLGAVLASALCDVLLTRAVDQHLRQAATELVHDIEALPAPTPSDVRTAIAEEAAEATSLGLDLAAFRAGTQLGGDPHLRAEPDGCSTYAELRACSVAGRDELRVVAAAPREPHALLFLAATLGAVVVAVLTAAAFSRRLARRALSPLARLQEDVAAVRATQRPLPAAHGEGALEVDALRATIVATMRSKDDAMARAERFAANAAHELRTPLTTLRGELELQLEARGSDPGLERSLRKVQQIEALTERLLLLALPSDVQPTRELIALGELVEDSILALAPDERARVELLDPGDVRLRADPRELEIVIGNGLSNALKFASHVKVELTRSQELVQMTFDDDGPGVAEAERDGMFDAFARGRRTDHVAGHGLGLALVRHVAERHGGSAVLLASTLHRSGCRLQVRLKDATSTTR